jgi:hypothetical protein
LDRRKKLDILSKIDEALKKDNVDNELLKEIAEHFNLEINEGLGDGILNTIKKKIKDIESDCIYVINLAKKVAKNTGNKDNIKRIDKEANDVVVQLKDLENLTGEMLDYMFGGDDLGSFRSM